MLQLGIIDAEIKEPIGGAHADYEVTANNMKSEILKALHELEKLSPEELKDEKYKKFRNMGMFLEL